MSEPVKRHLNPGTDDVHTVWWAPTHTTAVYITRGRNINDVAPFYTCPLAAPLTDAERSDLEPRMGDTFATYTKRLAYTKALVDLRVAAAAVDQARSELPPSKRYRITGNVTVGLMVLAQTYADLPSEPTEAVMRELLLASITPGDIREAAADQDYDIDFSLVDEPEFTEVF